MKKLVSSNVKQRIAIECIENGVCERHTQTAHTLAHSSRDESGIAVYSPHTAIDAKFGGVNDWLARAVGPSSSVRALVPATQPPPPNQAVKASGAQSDRRAAAHRRARRRRRADCDLCAEQLRRSGARRNGRRRRRPHRPVRAVFVRDARPRLVPRRPRFESDCRHARSARIRRRNQIGGGCVSVRFF